MKNELQNSKYSKHLCFVVFGYILFFSIYSILRHYSYLSTGYDLGIFMQSLWTTANGHGFFFNTGEWQDIGTYSHFGVHNQPILFLLVSIYKMFPHAETLLILQTIALALGAMTLFKFAKFILKNEKRAFYISLIYLVNPLIHGINRFDFHPVSIAVPFIFLISYYLEKQEYFKMIVISLIVLSVKEDSGLIFISLGLMYLLMKYKVRELINPRKWREIILNDKIPILLVILGFLWIILSLFVVIPHYNGGGYPYMNDGKLDRYGGRIYMDNIIVYPCIAILSTGFLPLLDTHLFLASIFLWLEIFLSNKPEMIRIGTHYPYMLIPMLLIISVYNLRRIKNAEIVIRKVNDTKHISISLKKIAGVSIISMLLFSPAFHVIELPQYIRGMPVQKLVPLYIKGKPYLDILDEVTRTLAQTNCTIVTQNMLFPHFANRENTYYIVTPFKSVYIPNNSIVIIDAVLPDYRISAKYLKNYTIAYHVNFRLINTTNLILECAEENSENVTTCIIKRLKNITRECHKNKP